jgi:hypothetical protein
MLPKFLYDGLPYIYIATAYLAVISIANPLAFMSGATLALTALQIFKLRGILGQYDVVQT